MFEPGNFVPRIDAIAHTALAHMPRADWHREVISFDRQRLDRLRTAMMAWIDARPLSQVAFGTRLVDPSTSFAVIEKLRAVAEGVRTATTHQDLADASAELAGAMRCVGLDRWAGFLRDAAERADAYMPMRERVMLAQAATPNIAMDVSPGGNPALSPAPGRYVADNPWQWIGQPSVGTGECVPLVQAATGASRSTEWRQGVPVQGNTAIRPGTAIATFDSDGRYTGHAAIYLGQDANGIRVIDQWNNRRDGRITDQHPPSERTLPFGEPQRALINRGESYRVVE